MYIVIMEKIKIINIFKMKIFWQLPLSIHNIYKYTFQVYNVSCNQMNFV